MRSKLGSLIIAIFMSALAFGQAGNATPPVVPPAPAPPAQANPAPPETPAAPRPKLRTRTMTVVQSGSYLGVDTRDVTSDRVAALKLKQPGGVEVTMVDQDAPAGKAGLKEHDVIVSFNGQRVENVQQLRRLIRETPAGKSAALGIMRDGQAVNVNATLANRRQVITRTMPGRIRVITPDVHIPAMAWNFDVPQVTVLQFWSRNGAVVEDLTPQLGEFFGVRNGEGVLVRTVEKGSPADAAGLHAGDVITRVNSERITSSGDWRSVMREQAGNSVSVGVLRDKREQALSMKLPEHKAASNLELPDMEKMNMELQRLGPQIQHSIDASQEQAMRELERSMESMERELERSQREFERAQRSREKQHADMERQMERAERDRERAQERAQRERDKAQQQSEQEKPEQTPPPAPPPQ